MSDRPTCFGSSPGPQQQAENDCGTCLHATDCRYPRMPASRASAVQVGGDHYKRMSIQPWDVYDTWPLEQRIGAYRSDAIKYLMRAFDKNTPLENVEKAGHLCRKLAEVLRGSGAQ